MSRVHAGDLGGAARAAICPNCERVLSEGAVCWRCCDRPCASCGRPTGSAFILFCWPCAHQAAETDAAAKVGELAPR